jgi:hypothetical protein
MKYLRESLSYNTSKPSVTEGEKPALLSGKSKGFSTLKEVLNNRERPARKDDRKPRAKLNLASPAAFKRKGIKEINVQSVNAADLKLVPVEKAQPPVPQLSYGLERVLFNRGVYQLRDPRSRVFNFDPYLQTIMPVTEFDFNALKEYITSSRDKSLISTAKAEEKKYTGSTSSMTSALAHFHFLLSQWRPINTATLSKNFPDDLRTFTALQRSPSAIFLRWRDGTYAIDADKQFDTANILSMLGKSMEKLLTLPTEDYERYRRVNSDQISEEERNEDEAFHYTTMGDFLMRSQLDAYDPRLPGTGMFDLKTRAVVSIRMDTDNYKKGMGYEIRNLHGEFESYEREYFDMIRSAFLKYSLQVRMGRMDGIFVAFHNTERIFGFQYISLSEMDFSLHGSEDTAIGDMEFKLSLNLLNTVLDRATAKYPKQSLRLHFETRTANYPFMYIFAEPVTEGEVQAIQESNKGEVEEFEKKVLNLNTEPTAEELEAQKDWENLQDHVQETMDIDERGVEAADADAVDGGGSTRSVGAEDGANEVEEEDSKEVDKGSTNAQENSDKGEVEYDSEADELWDEVKIDRNPSANAKSDRPTSSERDIMAMTLTIRNKVNGRFVERPEKLVSTDEWAVEYSLVDVPQSQAWSLYRATQKRRAQALGKAKAADKGAQNSYFRNLKHYSQKGRDWREQQDQLDQEEPLKVLDDFVSVKKI